MNTSAVAFTYEDLFVKKPTGLTAPTKLVLNAFPDANMTSNTLTTTANTYVASTYTTNAQAWRAFDGFSSLSSVMETGCWDKGTYIGKAITNVEGAWVQGSYITMDVTNAVFLNSSQIESNYPISQFMIVAKDANDPEWTLIYESPALVTSTLTSGIYRTPVVNVLKNTLATSFRLIIRKMPVDAVDSSIQSWGLTSTKIYEDSLNYLDLTPYFTSGTNKGTYSNLGGLTFEWGKAFSAGIGSVAVTTTVKFSKLFTIQVMQDRTTGSGYTSGAVKTTPGTFTPGSVFSFTVDSNLGYAGVKPPFYWMVVGYVDRVSQLPTQ